MPAIRQVRSAEPPRRYDPWHRPREGAVRAYGHTPVQCHTLLDAGRTESIDGDPPEGDKRCRKCFPSG